MSVGRSTTAALAALLCICLIVPSLAKVLHSRHEVHGLPRQWRSAGPANDSSPVPTFTIGLKQNNLDKLRKILYEVSTPGSERRGKFLTVDDVNNLVRTDPHHVNNVVQWLSDVGLRNGSDYTLYADAVSVHGGTVGVINKLLNTTIHTVVHRHRSRPDKLLALGDMHVPDELEDAVQIITLLSDFTPEDLKGAKPKAPKKEVLENAIGAAVASAQKLLGGGILEIVPKDLRYMYQQSYEVKCTTGATLAAGEMFGAASYSGEALDTYMKYIGEPLLKGVQKMGSDVPVSICSQSGLADEVALDTEIIAAMAPNCSLYQVTVPGNGWIYEYALMAVNDANTPQVHSLSYALPWETLCTSANTENPGTYTPSQCAPPTIVSGSLDYMSRVDTELMKLGARGVTILSASGDDGVCGANYNQNVENANWPNISPEYPALSEYVTAVGGVGVSGGSFVSCTMDICGISSGGGFSPYAPMPDYQQDFVNQFLSKNSGSLPPNNGLYNTSNRAYPDVAGLAMNYLVVVPEYDGCNCARSGSDPVSEMAGLKADLMSGTSASTPLVASMVTLANDMLLANGESVLGFLNPLLYDMARYTNSQYLPSSKRPQNVTKNAPAFQDVTQGGRNRCARGGLDPCNMYSSCGACTGNTNPLLTCGWCEFTSECMSYNPSNPSASECPSHSSSSWQTKTSQCPSCSGYSNCNDCTSNGCGWCVAEGKCKRIGKNNQPATGYCPIFSTTVCDECWSTHNQISCDNCALNPDVGSNCGQCLWDGAFVNLPDGQPTLFEALTVCSSGSSTGPKDSLDTVVPLNFTSGLCIIDAELGGSELPQAGTWQPPLTTGSCKLDYQCFGSSADLCCGDQSNGFEPAAGWDPVTGLGQLNFQNAAAYMGFTVPSVKKPSGYPIGSSTPSWEIPVFAVIGTLALISFIVFGVLYWKNNRLQNELRYLQEDVSVHQQQRTTVRSELQAGLLDE